MIVAITGARGFIARRLAAAHVAKGDEVRVLTRKTGIVPGCQCFVGDLAADGGIPDPFLDGVDVLYHCAAELRDESLMAAVNVWGTSRLLSSASGRIRRWVQLSSVGVYGHRMSGDVIEETNLSPENSYERSKAEADRLVMDAAVSGEFEWTLLRPSIVFGPDMPNQSVFQLAAMIRRGLFCFVGPPGASANYIPVDNVVDALLLCGMHPAAKGQIFNLSDWMTIEDFVGHIAGILGVRMPKLHLPLAPMSALAAVAGMLPGSPLSASRIAALSGRCRYPATRLETILGYRHRVSLAEGLRATLNVLNEVGVCH